MKTRRYLMLSLCLLPVLLLAAGTTAHAEEPLSCQEVFHRVWQDKQNNTLQDFQIEIEHSLQPATTSSCAAEYLHAIEPNLQEAALKLFRPARQNLFRALENYSPQQQQSSTTSSTSSVNPVSKATGPSAIAEEFSGVNVNSSTSALTFQFAPGTLLSNLEEASVVVPCSTSLRISRSCVGGPLAAFAERLTFSVTANTSTAGQAIKGTATSTTQAPSVPVTLSTAGTTEPSFGGFGVKAVAIYAPANTSTGDTAGQAQKTLDTALSEQSAQLANQLLSCSAYQTVTKRTVAALSAQSSEGMFLQILSSQYASLGDALFACIQTDQQLVKHLQDYLAAVLADAASENDINAARKPLLGFEYDLNTPQNQPSYSSVKANFSITFGKTRSKTDTSTKEKQTLSTSSCDTADSTSVLQPACAVASLVIATGQGTSRAAANVSDASTSLSNSKKQNAAIKGAAAGNTKPWAINASIAADVYNAEPSSNIPSASHLRDIQAGIEIDRILRSSKLPAIGSLIGDSTLAGVYYYQDQTSPSILKGPPQTITIADLPSTATQVYTSRGPINLGQIRLGLGTGSNVSFPICFTYSNRSGLITHPIKGLQFGLSYNLSSIFSGKSQ